ncbi:hypothetical protein WN51_12539 [Melipona quadrifasciata]|uniref:Uncharacterized protein n=1 Tax=Melipona quadrifasciata TaxID=166423 RepID=A0A0N0U5T7_9HYME|nr:hypothetical protein WN51_12539 [Melipona quadrifasciata]
MRPVSPQNFGRLAELCSTVDKALDPKRQRASALREPPWARDFPKPKEREPRQRPCFPSACKLEFDRLPSNTETKIIEDISSRDTKEGSSNTQKVVNSCIRDLG